MLTLTLIVYMASPGLELVDPSASIFGPYPPGTERNDPTPIAVSSTMSTSVTAAKLQDSQPAKSNEDSHAVELQNCRPSVSSAKATDTTGTSTLRTVENAESDEPVEVDSRKTSQASHAERHEGLGKYTMVYRTREHKETETKEKYDDRNAITKLFHAMGCCMSSSGA